MLVIEIQKKTIPTKSKKNATIQLVKIEKGAGAFKRSLGISPLVAFPAFAISLFDSDTRPALRPRRDLTEKASCGGVFFSSWWFQPIWK